VVHLSKQQSGNVLWWLMVVSGVWRCAASSGCAAEVFAGSTWYLLCYGVVLRVLVVCDAPTLLCHDCVVPTVLQGGRTCARMTA
jgi:hypothetical protein